MKIAFAAWSRRLLIVPPLAIGLAALFMAPALKSKPQQVDAPERAVKVRAIKISPLSVVPRTVGYGRIAPVRTWDAVAEVAGRVAWIADDLKDGRSVAAGTELLRIEDADYTLALTQIKAQLRASEVRDKTTRASIGLAEQDLKLLRDDLARKQALAAKGTAAKTTVEAAQRQVLGSEAQLQNLRNGLEINTAERAVLKAQMEGAELDLKRTAIRAPFDVRLTDVRIGTAQYANKGQILFTADGLDAIEVAAQFPIGVMRPLIAAVQTTAGEKDTLLLALNAVVRLRTASHTVEWPARIDRASGAIDPQTQSLGVVAVIDDPLGKAEPGRRPALRRNTFVEVELSAPEMDGRIAVPLSALHQGKAYVVDAEKRLAIRPIKVAFTQGGFAVIAQGLKPGEMLVTSDLPSAVEGMLLAPQEDRKTKRALVSEATGEEPQK